MPALPCCLACPPWAARATRDAGVLVAAAVCPHPPVLVPEAAAGGAAELDELRAACDAAVAAVAATAPDLIVTVGGAAHTAQFRASAAGSLAGYGVTWRTGEGTPVLPLSLTIGRFLLDRAGLLVRTPAEPSRVPPARFVAVGFDTPAATCLRLGAQIVRQAPRVALLVMGDGSARRSERAPGFFDPRAEPYDDQVTAALADADAAWLARLDPKLSADLLVAGRAAWQVLAGAAGGGTYRGHLHCAVAPYGVCYLVASWTPTDGARASTAVSRSGLAASSQITRGSRRNHDSCLRAKRRVARMVSSRARDCDHSPARNRSTCA